MLPAARRDGWRTRGCGVDARAARWTDGPPGDAAPRADAVEVREGDPRRRPRRAEVGRLPHDRVQGRRRDRAGQPQRATDDAVLPRTRRGPAGEPAAPLRRRRRDHPRERRAARLRRAATAHPSRRRAGCGCSRSRRRRRSSRSTCSRSATTTSWASRSANRRRGLVEALAGGIRPRLRHARDHRPRRGERLVHALRGRRPRRRRREAARRHVPARQAHDVQGQARAHRGLRRRGLPLAQDGRDRRLAPARALRRRRPAASRRRRGLVPDGRRASSSPSSNRSSRTDLSRASVGGVGRPGGAPSRRACRAR